MSYHSPPVEMTARTTHRCTSCGEPINPGEKYTRWMSVDDSMFTNKMHPECLQMHKHDTQGEEWEYSLYSYDRPVRVGDAS